MADTPLPQGTRFTDSTCLEFSPSPGLRAGLWGDSRQCFRRPLADPRIRVLTQGGQSRDRRPGSHTELTEVLEITLDIERVVVIPFAELHNVVQPLYMPPCDLIPLGAWATDRAEHDWPALGVGRCVLRSRVPARFLNEGTYRVELVAFLPSRWLMQAGVSAPQMTLVIQGGLSDSPLWVAKRPGVLGPVLLWDKVREATVSR